jgi:hypothetical protein
MKRTWIALLVLDRDIAAPTYLSTVYLVSYLLCKLKRNLEKKKKLTKTKCHLKAITLETRENAKKKEKIIRNNFGS